MEMEIQTRHSKNEYCKTKASSSVQLLFATHKFRVQILVRDHTSSVCVFHQFPSSTASLFPCFSSCTGVSA